MALKRINKMSKLITKVVALDKRLDMLGSKLYKMVDESQSDHPKHNRYIKTLNKIDKLDKQRFAIEYKIKEILQKMGLKL